MRKNRLIIPALLTFLSMQGYAQELNDSITSGKPAKYSDEVVEIGYHKAQRLEESTSSISTVYNEDFNKRSAKNIANSLFGYGTGLTTLQGSGRYADAEPTFFIRGLQSLSTNNPLILVDGIERPMAGIDINSVASISVLKDASATAVYGVKGANGVILITTKRGSEGKATINAGASMAFKIPSKLPNKMDSYDAFTLRNSAIEYELGLVPDSWTDMVPRDIMNKYRNPANLEEAERYPNVDWNDWMFKDYAVSENVNVSIHGGTRFAKYYAAVDYQHEGDLFKELR